MPIQVVCSKCGTRLSAPDDAAGKRVRCKCGEILAVPAAGDRATAEVPARASPVPVAPGLAPIPKGPSKVPKGPSKAPPVPSAASGSLLDVLTDRDLKQSQTNPYAPPPKATTSDSAALKTYLRTDDTKKEKAKASETNLILLTVCFFLGVAINGFIVAAMFLLATLLQGAAGINPLIRLGSLFAIIFVVYALFDLAVAIGLIVRKPWGWWMCVVGLAWAIVERVTAVGTMIAVSEEISRSIGAVIGGFIFCTICISLINFMMQPDTKKKFGLEVRSGMAWGIAIATALVLGGIAFGIGFVAGSQLDEAATVIEAANTGGEGGQ